MIIDGHAHLSAQTFGGLDKLLQDMSDASIDKAVLVPGGMLDVRRMAGYLSGKEKPVTAVPPNHLVLEAMRKYPERFYGFYCMDPGKGASTALRELEQARKDGFCGLKLAPLVHRFAFSDPATQALASACGELGFPFYTHVVSDASADIAALAKLAAMFPATNFVIGHMGMGHVDTEAIDVAAKLGNVYLETSLASPLAVLMAVRTAGAEKCFFGSEFPLSDPVVEKVKIERLPIPDKEKEKIWYQTLTGLLKAPGINRRGESDR
jgi:predicted TIM-barrel fold metal-dependent hydrolase